MKNLNIFFLLPFAALLLCAKCEKDEIMASLPAAAKNYIDQKYPGSEVENAEQEKDCNGNDIIEVEVEPSEDNEMELVFDLAGNLLFSETKITIANLPVAVKNAISTQFSGYSIKEAERLDMAAGGTRYEVEIKKGGSTLDVTFDSEGTEICREED
jgi:uncharacterized membrane protein YkoI